MASQTIEETYRQIEAWINNCQTVDQLTNMRSRVDWYIVDRFSDDIQMISFAEKLYTLIRHRIKSLPDNGCIHKNILFAEEHGSRFIFNQNPTP